MTALSAYQEVAEPVDPRFASVDCLFFVIGAQKAGTTWLSHYFKAHPNVAVPEWKEHDYWNMVEGRPHASRMLQTQRARRARFSPLRSLAASIPFTLHAKRQRAITLALKATEATEAPFSAYADVLMENTVPATQAVGEVCPEYALLRSETYARMAALAPNVRFVFVMRDPVARFISGVRHTLRKTHGKSQITEQMLSDALINHAESPAKRPYRLTDYERTVTALEQSVPSQRILYMFFETMFDQAKVRDVCGFLGVPFVAGPTERRRNVAGKAAVPVREADKRRIAQALKPVYAFAQARFGRELPQKWRESAALC